MDVGGGFVCSAGVSWTVACVPGVGEINLFDPRGVGDGIDINGSDWVLL